MVKHCVREDGEGGEILVSGKDGCQVSDAETGTGWEAKSIRGNEGQMREKRENIIMGGEYLKSAEGVQKRCMWDKGRTRVKQDITR